MAERSIVFVDHEQAGALPERCGAILESSESGVWTLEGERAGIYICG